MTKRYVAGAIVSEGRVAEAAPILRWSVGQPIEELTQRIEEQGGTVEAASLRRFGRE